MKGNAFIHVGFPKTGTTSIQKSLAASRDVLGGYGISYPGTEDDHVDLAALFHPKGPEHFYFVMRSIPDPVGRGNRLLAEGMSSERDLIFSSEYLHNIGEKNARNIYNVVSKAGFHTRFVCYIRHPVDAAVSSAQQSIKMGHRSLAEVIAEPWYASIRQNLEPFVKAVGKENVILKDFKAATGGGLLKSFMEAVERPEVIETMTEISANEGLTMDAAIFCDLHRKHYQETGKYLFPKSIVFDFTDGKFDLPPKSKDIVREAGRGDVEWVEREFGITLTESVNPPRFHPNPSVESVVKVIEAVRR